MITQANSHIPAFKGIFVSASKPLADSVMNSVQEKQEGFLKNRSIYLEPRLQAFAPHKGIESDMLHIFGEDNEKYNAFLVENLPKIPVKGLTPVNEKDAKLAKAIVETVKPDRIEDANDAARYLAKEENLTDTVLTEEILDNALVYLNAKP